MTINSIEEAEAALASYVPRPTQQFTRKDTTLDRIKPLMALLGNPQDRLRVIHIAGTSGKTSTAYYMAAMLTAAGQKTGLTVSPHVDSVTERVQINGQPLDEASFSGALSEFLDIIQAAQQPPSYFELIYAFAIWVFAKHEVDYAVVETGLGGLHDATNVVTRTDKLCVITDIGFDHTHLLGNTLAEIAVQKAGIIHEGNAVFTYQQAYEIMQVIRQAAESHQAELHIVTEFDQLHGSTIMPDYQRHNWILAQQVYEYLVERDGLQPLTSEVLRKTQELQIPARMDSKQINGKNVIMDGAHNAQKMTAFVNSFKHLYPDIKPTIMIALKDDKEYQSVIPILAPIAGEIITTTFNTTQDLPVTSMDPELLAQAFRGIGAEASSIPDQNEALEALLQTDNDVCIITGSFYLLSQIRNSGLSK